MLVLIEVHKKLAFFETVDREAQLAYFPVNC